MEYVLKSISYMLYGFLAVISCVVFQKVWNRTAAKEEKSSEAQQGAAKLLKAIAKYKYEIGSLPPNLQALTNKQPKFAQFGPWATEDDLKDAWGRAYTYSCSNDNKQYAVWYERDSR